MHAPSFKWLEGRKAAIHVEQRSDGNWQSFLMCQLSPDPVDPMRLLCGWERKSRSGALFVAKRVAQGFDLRIEDRVYVTPHVEA
jgi:hypothetical protein